MHASAPQQEVTETNVDDIKQQMGTLVEDLEHRGKITAKVATLARQAFLLPTTKATPTRARMTTQTMAARKTTASLPDPYGLADNVRMVAERKRGPVPAISRRATPGKPDFAPPDPYRLNQGNTK